MIGCEQLINNLREHGIDPGGELIEGKVTRTTCSCKPSKKGKDGNGWYLYYADEPATLTWGCWNTDCQNAEGGKLTAKSEKTLTPAERETIKARINAERKAREEERQRVEQATREKTARLWKSTRDVSADHPYLVNGGNFRPVGARQVKDMLVVPMSATGIGEPESLQLIFPDGTKRFLTGTGAVPGPLYHAIKGNGGPLYIAEGWKTGCSIHEASGASVVIAFSSGRLPAVAEVLKSRFPGREIIIAGDQGNGSGKAIEAARKIGGKVVLPTMPDGIEGTDFNDLYQAAGLKEVSRQLATAAEPLSIPSLEPENPSQATTEATGDEWPEPQPIESKMEPLPYPIDALPESIGLAVEEVIGFVKAPVVLVASAAISALSMAIQAHADIARAEKLTGPAGLYLLTIAESGERKSTCDNFFTKAIREHESARAEAAKPAIKKYEAEYTAWDAKYKGITDSIKQTAKNGKNTDAKEADLLRLQEMKPQPPRVPRIIYGDTTPEALKYSLAKQWPSGAVVSSEAGVVFGSHGMGKESAMRNLATLNQLWDGTDMPTERRSSESFTVRGARLTMALQTQESTLRAFFKASGELARGTGFLARFLIAWPESTQGQRPFTEAPENWPHLAAFNRRITEILNQDVPIDDDGALHPAMATLTPEAKAAWVAFHDAIESELVTGGELFDIRDIASKIADNAARLACLFQFFEHGGGEVGLDAFESASRVAAWHLNEARRFFGGLALPQELADAARLDSWMLEYCRMNKTGVIPVTKIQQYGPCGLRSKVIIDAAMEELEGLERARRVKDGKRKTIHINPALIGGEI